MYQLGGVYAGKHIWASSFNEGRFDDQEISCESVQNYAQDFVTSDRESIKGKSQKEMALAYYAYKYIKNKRKNQEKVFEILCGDEKADLFVFDGFEQKHATEILHQTEYLAAEDSEKILAAKYIIQLFVEKYPDSEELENAQEKIEYYEYDLINEDSIRDFSLIKELIESIYDQIDFIDDIAHIELLGYECEIKKEWYSEQVSENVLDNYISLVQKLLSHINNNFEIGDLVVIYSKQVIDTQNTKNRIDQIAKNNCIEIIVERYSEKFVSRGNAYFSYLVNNLQFNRIKKNIGRYTVIFEGSRTELQLEKSNVQFVSINDFSDRYIFRIIDNITNTYRDIEMLVPFSVSGTNLDFIYTYDSLGLIVSITDCNSKEIYTEAIGYDV